MLPLFSSHGTTMKKGVFWNSTVQNVISITNGFWFIKFEPLGFLHTENDKSIGLCKRTSHFGSNTTSTAMQTGQFASKKIRANQPKTHLTKFWSTTTVKRNGDVFKSNHRYIIYRPSARTSLNFIYVRSLESAHQYREDLWQNLWVTLYSMYINLYNWLYRISQDFESNMYV
jgi:hypothetical protein